MRQAACRPWQRHAAVTTGYVVRTLSEILLWGGMHMNESDGVEVVRTPTEVIVRNTEAPDRELRFTLEEWAVFIAGVKRGEFDPAAEE
jgi:Domain of unknown function (DUF397)